MANAAVMAIVTKPASFPVVLDVWYAAERATDNAGGAHALSGKGA
jgi:hypothetical protein